MDAAAEEELKHVLNSIENEDSDASCATKLQDGTTLYRFGASLGPVVDNKEPPLTATELFTGGIDIATRCVKLC